MTEWKWHPVNDVSEGVGRSLIRCCCVSSAAPGLRTIHLLAAGRKAVTVFLRSSKGPRVRVERVLCLTRQVDELSWRRPGACWLPWPRPVRWCEKRGSVEGVVLCFCVVFRPNVCARFCPRQAAAIGSQLGCRARVSRAPKVAAADFQGRVFVKRSHTVH